MPALTCSVHDCAYNRDHHCCNGRIQVEGNEACGCGETCCASFADKCGCGCQNAAASSETSVGCSAASCRFNENFECRAQRVSIEGTDCCCKNDTCCASFERA